MAKAIGMVEVTTVSAGFTAADEMAKAADVEILQAEVTCPGKFVILVTGELSAVRASVDRADSRFGDKVIDTFVLGNPHESIFPAIYGTAQPETIDALGILETYDVAASGKGDVRQELYDADRKCFGSTGGHRPGEE